MNEFNNRITAQREIITSINSRAWHEELLGLSHGALERWFSANNINTKSNLADLLKDAAAKLFFLANKSQEQITNDYKLLSLEVSRLTDLIRQEVKKHP